MKFLTRISNGWELAKISFATINKNRSLLLFPVFSVLSLILVLATFCGGAFFLAGDEISAMLDDEQQGNALLGYSIVFLYYLINFFIIVFFNSALIHCAVKTLNDEETSLSDGISFAFSRIDKILGWSVLSATVGTLLQVLHNTGKIGEIVASLIGIAWSILTFFVVPVLIYEDKGVIESVKESGRLMKAKWGESLAANVSFGFFHFLGILAAFAIGFLLAPLNMALAIVVGVALVFFVSTVISAAQTVFVAAVYNHVTGRPIGNFDGDTLDSVFITK
ncbi:MAG: hypothetical protein KA165_04165 [Saprospiraceae bacterium]|nr:hypothetical protein [Saprospiraceae bacterium]